MKKKMYRKVFAVCLCGILMSVQGAWGAEFSSGEETAQDAAIFSSGEEETKQIAFSDSEISDMVSVDRDHFPDNKFRHWILENVDVDGNEILSEEEISQITEMDISSLGLDDIKGVELFANLERLNCSENMIRLLDLSGNKKLRFLDCSKNELNRLDLFYQTELKVLNVSGNPVMELALESLPLLEELDVSRTALSGLDISANTKLRILKCQEASIFNLEFSNNLLLEEIYCRQSALSELDVSALQDLRVLDCSMNSLWHLDLAKNTKLEALYCQDNLLENLQIENLTRLKELNYIGNRLLNVDLRNCPLETLCWGDGTYWTSEKSIDLSVQTGIRSEDVASVENGYLENGKVLVPEDMSKPVKLTYTVHSKGVSAQGSVDIYMGYLDEKDFVSPAVYLAVSQNVQTIDFGMISLAQLEKVTTLILNEMDISDFSDLKYFPNLTFLECSKNPVQELDLSANKNLVTLICTETPLKKLDLRKNKKLDLVEVYNNQLTELRIEGLENLTYLDCRFNNMKKLDRSGCVKLKEMKGAPQKQYTVYIDETNTIPFSRLANFDKKFSPGDQIVSVKGMGFSSDKKSFVVKPFSGEYGKVSFSIFNEFSSKIIGTCTIKAVPKIENKPVPGKPELLKAVSSSGVTLTWKKTMDKVTGYRIMRKEAETENASWKVIGTVNHTRNSYTDRTGKLNVKYDYTVQSFVNYKGKIYYSKYDTVGKKGKAFLKGPSVSKVKSAPSLEISWTKSSGTDGYRVYRKEQGGTGWKLLAELGKYEGYYLDETAVPGKVYGYLVRTYRKIDGRLSLGGYGGTGFTCKASIGKAEIMNIIIHDGVTSVQWKPMNMVSGYQIVRSEEENGTYHEIAKVQGNGNPVYTEEQVFSAGEVYYKIRAYKEIDGKFYYGAFSGPQTITKFEENTNAKDFSEFHMGYSLSRQGTQGFDRELEEGGDYIMASAYLTRGSGPVMEWQVPYDNPYPAVSNPMLQPRYQIEEVLFLPMRNGPLDNQAIKQAIYQYGGVATDYFSDPDCYSDDQSSYYSHSSSNPDLGPVGDGGEAHAVTVIGWDDNYPKELFKTQPEGDGAFLCKNSWGEEFGIQGYFYVSYYDPVFARAKFSAVFTKASERKNTGKVYQYDPLGATTTYGYEDELFQANVFPPEGQVLEKDERVQAVSFYTYDAGYSYEVYIIEDYKNKASFYQLGEPVAKGIFSYAGYHTVKLDKTVTVKAGNRFGVVIHLQGENGAMGYFEAPIEFYSSNASAGKGESFVSHHGDSWSDITLYLQNTNACIKAFTDGNPEENTPAEPVGESTVYSVSEVLEKGFEINPDFLEKGDFSSPAPIGKSVIVQGVLPEKFDLRETGQVTPVKDQGNLGLCWAFATYGSLESCMLK